MFARAVVCIVSDGQSSKLSRSKHWLSGALTQEISMDTDSESDIGLSFPFSV